MGSRRVIARNTLLLYVRMAVTMIISLITSRVVLDSLGIEDYGLYNVIGGVVIMFTFLNGSLASATLRFLNFGLGKQSGTRVSIVYSSSIIIHILISLVIVLLSETIGLWFVHNKLVIPPNRFEIALWVYQLSILTCVANVMSAPFHAVIIANERMGAFAYISILESILKLGVALLIFNCIFDHLLVYAFLIMLINFVICIIKALYSKRAAGEIKMHWKINKSILRKLGSFSAWNLIGSLALMGVTQGTNMLLNMFYGPVVNAARAIAVQVQAAVSGLSKNIQTAATPQIMQSYAGRDYEYMHYLIVKCAKYSFFALFTLALPIIIEIKPILSIWLKEVPPYTAEFVVILMIISLIDSTTGPLISSVNATGRIRNYQLSVGLIILSVVPISYIALKLFKIDPMVVFIITLLVDMVALIVRLLFCKKQVNLNVVEFLKTVYGRVLMVVMLSVPLPLFCHQFINGGVARLIAVFFVGVITTLAVTYGVGMTKGERKTMNNYIKVHFLKKNG